LTHEHVSEITVSTEKTKVGKEGSRSGMSRRKIFIVAMVASTLIGFVAATSLVPVSKLTTAMVNYSDQDLLFRVYVDDFGERAVVLEPNESLTFSWNLTGWLHKYDIFARSPNMLVSWYHTWTYIIILPFSEKVITNER